MGENLEDYEVTGVHVFSRKNYIINFCEEYDHVELFHDVNNEYSSEAIGIKHENKIIGYISRHDVEEVHKIIKMTHKAHISEIDYDGSYLNVRVEIEF